MQNTTVVDKQRMNCKLSYILSTSPEKKHAEKVKGLLELIDAQFESMHQYNQSCENQFHTEPCEVFQQEANPLKKTNSTERGENRYKSVLSNMLNLVNSETLKSQQLSHSITSKQRSKWDYYQTPNKRSLTNQSVQNQSQADCSKTRTQGTNISVDASSQTKANKQKKMGYFVYQLSYQSPKCNHYIEQPKNIMEQCFGDKKTKVINDSSNIQKKQVPKQLISCLQVLPRNNKQQTMQNMKVFCPPKPNFNSVRQGIKKLY